jgi:hypothetical protein
MNSIIGTFMIFGMIFTIFFGFPLICVFFLNCFGGSIKPTSAVNETLSAKEYQTKLVAFPIPVIKNNVEAEV